MKERLLLTESESVWQTTLDTNCSERNLTDQSDQSITPKKIKNSLVSGNRSGENLDVYQHILFSIKKPQKTRR